MKNENLIILLDNYNSHPDKEIVKRASLRSSSEDEDFWGVIVKRGIRQGLHVILPATFTTISLCFKIVSRDPQIRCKHFHLMPKCKDTTVSHLYLLSGKRKAIWEWQPRWNWCQDAGARADGSSRITKVVLTKETSEHKRHCPLNFVCVDRLKFSLSVV